jgi:hypothetical protein
MGDLVNEISSWRTRSRNIKVGGLVRGLPDMRSCKVTGSFSSSSDR